MAPSRKSNNLQITANNMWLEPPLLPIYPIHNLHNRQNYDSIISKNPLLQQQQQDYRNRYNLINRPCPNVSTTPNTAMGCRQCLPLIVVQLKGKHCPKPHCCNGVVDTFEPCDLENHDVRELCKRRTA